MTPLPVAAAARAAVSSVYRRARKQTGTQPHFTGKAPSFVLYGGIGLIALLKDLLDWMLIGSFPGIGTVVTLCFNILIFLLFLFDSSGGGRRDNRVLARAIILIGVTLVEAIGFGLNFLPLQTLVVIALYIMANRAYQKEAKAHAAENQQQTKQERLAEQRELAMMQSMQAELEAQQAAEAEAEAEDEQSETPGTGRASLTGAALLVASHPQLDGVGKGAPLSARPAGAPSAPASPAYMSPPARNAVSSAGQPSMAGAPTRSVPTPPASSIPPSPRVSSPTPMPTAPRSEAPLSSPASSVSPPPTPARAPAPPASLPSQQQPRPSTPPPLPEWYVQQHAKQSNAIPESVASKQKDWPGKERGLPPPLTPEFGVTEQSPMPPPLTPDQRAYSFQRGSPGIDIPKPPPLPPQVPVPAFDFSQVPPLPKMAGTPPPLPDWARQAPPPPGAWSPESGTPSPLTPEYGVNEPTWPGKERGLPPALPQATFSQVPPPLPGSVSGMIPPPLPPTVGAVVPPPPPSTTRFENVSAMKERVIEKPERLSSKQTSKRFLSEERKKLAKEFRAQRKKSRSKLLELASLTERATASLTGERADTTKINENYAALSDARAREASNIAQRLATGVGMSREDAEEERENIRQLVNNDNDIRTFREKLSEHYAKSGRLAEEKLEKIQKRIEQTALRNGIFFVHTIQERERLRHNELSNVAGHSTYEDDADILLALEPTISASSVFPGRSEEGKISGLWSETGGFLIGGGDIRYGARTDLDSRSVGIKDRAIAGGYEYQSVSDIDRVAQKRGDSEMEIRRDTGEQELGTTYNEFIVDNPEVLGYFQPVGVDERAHSIDRKYWAGDIDTKFEADELSRIRKKLDRLLKDPSLMDEYTRETPELYQKKLSEFKNKINRYKERFTQMESRGTPLYVMTPHREVYECIGVNDDGTVKIGKELTPEEVAHGQAGLSSEKRIALGDKVLQRNLFKDEKSQAEAEKIVNELKPSL